LVPDHELLRLIGRGSYGEVWLARNVMGAWRAVKIVRRETFGSDRPFEREFSGIQRYEPISRSVDGVVPILQVGRNPESFYYVMELADDASGTTSGNGALAVDTYAPRSLRSDLKRLGRLPVADCLELGLALAAGLTHLHRHRLVHRDLKPSNLIFVNGRARLADPGLVGAIDEARSFVGTMGYIPPEGPGSPGADIFALGRVLYESVTGFPPDDFPNPPPDWLIGEIPHGAIELHEVILRACETDPARRYQSAAALQADLALLQSGQSVRRARKLERRVKTLRRVGLAAVGAVLLASGLGTFAAYRARSEHASAARAETLRQRAVTAEEAARLELANAQLARAGLLRRSGLVGQRIQALELIRQAAGVTPSLVELRTEAIAARALPDLREKRSRTLTGPPGQWCAVDAAFNRYTRAHTDGSVRVHAWDDDRELAVLEGAQAEGLSVWSRGQRLGGRHGEEVFVWDTATGRRLFRRLVPGAMALDLSPDGAFLALRLSDGRVQCVRLVDGTAGPVIDPGFTDGVFLFSPDSRRLAFVSPSRCEVHLFDALGGSRQILRLPPPACPQGLRWTPDSRGLLLTADDFRGYLIRPDQPDPHWLQVEGHQAEIVDGVGHPKLPYALTTSWDDTTRLWSLATGRQLLRAAGRGTEFRWGEDGRLGWLEAGEPGHFRLREFEMLLPAGVLVLPEPVPPRAFASSKGAWDVAFVAEGRALAVASYDGVRIWPIHGGEPQLLHLGWTRWLEAGSGGTTLWASTDRQILRVPLSWDPVQHEVQAGEPQSVGAAGRELPLAPPGNASALFSARGRELLSIAADAVRFLGELPDWTTRLRASPDGRWLLAGDRASAEMHLLSSTNGQPIRVLKVSYDAHGLFLAGGEDLLLVSGNELRRERCTDGRLRWTVPRPGSGSSAGPMAVAPDGRTVAVAPGGSAVTLLDGDTGEVWCRLEAPEPGSAVALRFSPDGRHLAVATANHTAVLWDLAGVRAGLRELNLDWPAPH
jgi:WD40 repeat protein